MKFTIFIVLAAAAVLIEANPISVSNNNVGDIVTVGVNANAQLSSSIETNLVTVLLGLINQQAALINADIPEGIVGASANGIVPQLESEGASEPITVTRKFVPEALVEKIKNLKVSPELIEAVKAYLKKE
jgi:hypothetical protein